MTESEWLSCSDPQKMLEFLRGKASERKLRLFLVACARLVWDQLAVDTRMTEAVVAVERYVDGLASHEELETSHMAIYQMLNEGLSRLVTRLNIPLDVFTSLHGLSLCCGFSRRGLDHLMTMMSWHNGTRLTGQHQPFILRDIFANPFAPVALDPAWLLSDVEVLGRAIYETRCFDRLPILANTLEAARCTDPRILEHCRGSGPHYRGCWVLDLLLGKE